MRPGCSLCDRQSLLIYPVRYAVACPSGAEKAPALSGNFKIDSRAPQSAGSAKYTLRALRAGYLYTYDEKRRVLRGYVILPNGIMGRFNPNVLPPPANMVKALAHGCATETDLVSLSRCVDVAHTPGVNEATNLWIGWSNVAWTSALVQKVLDSPGGAQWRKQHMQCINIPALLAGGETDTGEFAASSKQIAHFAMDEQALQDAFEFSNTSTVDESKLHGLDNVIAKAMSQTPNKKGFVVAVNDPVGMTNDLAELTVPSLANGFDEEIFWKTTSFDLLDRAKKGIQAQASAATGLSYGISKSIADANVANVESRFGAIAPDPVGLIRLISNAFKSGSLERAAKEDAKNMSDIAAAQKKAAEDAWLEASTKIDDKGKRVSVLDQKALDSFPQESQKALDAFKPTWQPLVQAHAGWLKSELLSDWMAGVTDDKDIRSGYAYSESCAQAIGAAAGTDECTKVLEDWLAQPRLSDTRNIYARAMLFNQEDLMKAADAQIRGSDIQYEAFMNLYKGALERLRDNRTRLYDRLMLTTGNTVVRALTKTVHSAGYRLLTIRLSLQGGVVVKPSEVDPLKLQKWTLAEIKKRGIDIEGNRVERRRAAAQASKQAHARATANPSVVLLELDTDTLQRTGRLDPDAIKTLKVPGAETMRKWLGSAAPQDFNLGVVTAVIQMVTLTFAVKDWYESDQFSKDENAKKFYACLLSWFGNVVETISLTAAAFHERSHPLSAYIWKKWPRTARFTTVGKFVGRGMGSVAGAYFAWTDLFMSAPEARQHEQYGLQRLYLASGMLGIYVSFISITGYVPGFWPVFVLAIAISVGIAKLKDAALKGWIEHCKFSTDKTYCTLKDEVVAFNFAVGG